MPDKQKRPRTLALYNHAKQRIPGGTQLLSKRPELMAPDQWPAYYARAKGCRVWDLDGNRYYDMATNGIGACLLGFADPDVSRAVTECVKRGSMSTLNPPEEVELADLLCRIHPWAECVRFARTGGEIAAVAVRIAMEGAHRSFISSTYWTERVGPVAALATLEKLARSNVPSRIAGAGARVMNTWREKGNKHDLPVKVDDGYPCLAHFKFDHEKETVLRTLYAQYMLRGGFLASCTFYPTVAHDDKVLDRFDRAVDKAFRKISRALKKGNPEAVLDGPVAHTGFARLN